jgi:hypothetical protein
MKAQTCFAIGIVLLLLGIQFRRVETFVLNEKASQFVERRMRDGAIRTEGGYDPLILSTGTVPRKRLTHPRWVGWAFLSVGGVLVLHGLTLKPQE